MMSAVLPLPPPKGDLLILCGRVLWAGLFAPLLFLLFCIVLWGVSTAGMVADFRGVPMSAGAVMATYVVAQGIGTSGVTTLGKLLALVDGSLALSAVLFMFGAVGVTNTYSSVAAAQKINQGEFIPFASCCSLLINAAMGFALWQDGKSITMWVTCECRRRPRAPPLAMPARLLAQSTRHVAQTAASTSSWSSASTCCRRSTLPSWCARRAAKRWPTSRRRRASRRAGAGTSSSRRISLQPERSGGSRGTRCSTRRLWAS